MASKASEQQTGTRDETYNLVSVLYHALQGIETYEQYVRDAEKSGDQELAQFFRDCQDNHRSCAERAKNLLGARMMGHGTGTQRAGSSGKAKVAKSTTNASVKSGGNPSDDCVDEQSKESFPASDPPGSY